MKSLAIVYDYILQEVQHLKKNGVSFTWHNIDLSELFISDLISIERSTKKLKRINRMSILKLKWSAFKKKRLYKKNSRSKNASILVFINELNQWDNIEPVYNILTEQGIKIDVVSTKEKIIKCISPKYLSVKLIVGFHFPKRQFVNNTNEHGIITAIYNNMPRISFLYSKFNTLLTKSTYKYVIIGNDITTEGKLLSILAKRLHIHSGSIQHGSMNRVNPIHGLSRVDDFFVYGARPANEMIFLGKPKENIVVCGWPMQQQFKEKLANIRSSKNGKPLADLLVCLSGPGHSVDANVHTETINLIAKLQEELNLNIIVKLHPKDKKAYYSNLSECRTIIYDNELLSEKGSSLLALYTQVKCTLTVASNAALESLLTETPVITIDIDNSFNDVDYIQDGLTYHATNYIQLKQQYEKIVDDNNVAFSNELKFKIEKYYYSYFNENYNPSVSIANKILKVCVE